MADEITEESLQERREHVASLRQQLLETEQERITRENHNSMVVTAAQLDAEAAGLQAQLEAAKNAASPERVNDGALAPLASAGSTLAAARAQMEAEQQRQAAASQPVDPDAPVSTRDPRLAEPAEDAVTPDEAKVKEGQADGLTPPGLGDGEVVTQGDGLVQGSEPETTTQAQKDAQLFDYALSSDSSTVSTEGDKPFGDDDTDQTKEA